MAGATEKEVVTFLGLVEKLGLRLGSTRWLNLATTLAFLAWMLTQPVTELSPWVLLAAVALTLLTGLSFHLRPHIDRKPNSTPEKGTDPNGGTTEVEA